MAEIYLSGVVGYDITAKQVKSFVDEATDDHITIFLSSPGGYVVDGLEIYNILRASGKKIKTVNMALCASMGSILFLAGDERIAMPGSLYMVHKPSGIVWGNADDMRKEIEVLDKMQESLQAIYSDRAGIEDIQQLVDDETWFSVEDMKKMGVVNSDEKIQFSNASTEKDEPDNKNKNEVTDEMPISEEIKAELEALRAENQALLDEKEEREAEAEIARLKAENEEMRAAKVKTRIEVAQEPNLAEENSEDNKATDVIDTTNAVSTGDSNIPAFLNFKSKY
ncbi:Clp protease ClpP [Enterococcus faecium]|uniref:head maturation protease, ClpP-related n=1 Tax=Enterococcus faecium TaxID=1352 RepID=UPI0019250B65|nr:head maturation protease, ClpP-related [Enterococcus faecium]EGP4894208.1 Clp protease ClpP [Enterococcus faecium]EHK9936764.1 Clp protease ClpP [Enterococcus faecium]MBL3708356.1 hypothetical protein [Enterococcus faecium]